MPRTNFEADVRGIGDMLTADYMREAMRVRIKAVEGLAIANSPVDEGDYVASFETDTGIQRGRPQPGVPVNRRAYGELTNVSDHAIHVEYGQNGVRKSAPMRKALRSLTTGFARSTYRDEWVHRW